MTTHEAVEAVERAIKGLSDQMLPIHQVQLPYKYQRQLPAQYLHKLRRSGISLVSGDGKVVTSPAFGSISVPIILPDLSSEK